MSPSHPHTVSVAAVNPLLMYDDEDNDICPVCDGECTCDNRPRSFSTMSNRTGSVQSIASSSTYNFASPAPAPPAPTLPSLKIKFTVPPSMLGKRRAPSYTTKKYRSAEETTYGGGSEKDISLPPPGKSHLLPPSSPSSQDLSVPKRRGRPPKAVLAARDLKGIAAAHATTTLAGPSYQSQPARSYKRKDPLLKPKTKAVATRRLPKHKVKGTIVKKSAAKKRRVVSSDSSSDLSDVPPNFGYGEDDDDDAQSVQFPTFVPASAMSASTSSNDSDMASSSGFDTDSSIEAEEENFILAEESRSREKARVRRELLGDESGQKRRDPHNDWVIRPRKQSVGPSDAEMDVDSDATEDEEEDEEEEAAEADEEEPDDRAPGEGYAGVATGWSEDEESSFDADLFFANLSDTSGEDGTSSSDDDDVNQSDMDTLTLSEATMASLIPHLRQELENLPFEVTEGWDGQIVFTNGLRDGQGILDLDFEVNAAAQLAAETSASPSQESDVDMTSDGEDEDEADEAFGDGETTDEELVGEDQLPNERAMKLYNPITSVSAINPMSTMSPTVSPGPWNRRRFGSPIHRDSPKPADILAGKVFWDESDEPEDGEDSPYQTGSVGSLPRPPLNTLIEVEPGEKNPQRRVVIDGTKPTPCPYPRSKHGRGRSISRLGRFDDILRGRLQSRTSSLPASSRSSLHLLSSEETPTSPEQPPTEPIDLDDVLEASYLDTDELQQGNLNTSGEANDSRRHLKNLSRWDVISVGAFRQTREAAANNGDPAAGWGSDPPSGDGFPYGNIMKTSPLSTMLWQNKGNAQKRSSRTTDISVVISPVILPVRDGDRTPTNAHSHIPPPPLHQNEYPHKTRKESRREKKTKRKNCGPVHQQHQHHQHHHHPHHPNMKSRGSGSMQRTNFFATSSVPSLSI